MNNVFKYKKAVQALNFFAIKEQGSINKMKAIKLIWLAERLHLRKYGRPIIFDNFYAMKLGPVASSTKDLAQFDNPFLSQEEIEYRNEFIQPSSDNYSVSSKQALNQKVFSKSDITILENVYNEFGHLSEFDLSEFSHKFQDWSKYENHLNSGYSRINMKLDDFFHEETFVSTDISDKEYLQTSKQLYEENYLM